MTLPIFHLDYNGADSEGFWPTLPEHGNSPVNIGDRILTTDGEGNSCEATVDHLRNYGRGDILYLVPDWDTWNSSECKQECCYP